ncbi:hypothetical protein AVEN_93409-1 [Araneus ventricosus]|uniref:Uncharacterized protein n=1 Tax=Araneus ventricosus TaxID=182803 RepID=A0A4Y2AP71_ARAVE|nr:hypothetical protein AVEN_93409-1 [Araneus ventricosus]
MKHPYFLCPSAGFTQEGVAPLVASWIPTAHTRDYEPIDCSIPDIDRNLLSKDQQYLLDISNAITLGHCPEDLANQTLVLRSIPYSYCGQPSP